MIQARTSFVSAMERKLANVSITAAELCCRHEESAVTTTTIETSHPRACDPHDVRKHLAFSVVTHDYKVINGLPTCLSQDFHCANNKRSPLELDPFLHCIMPSDDLLIPPIPTPDVSLSQNGTYATLYIKANVAFYSLRNRSGGNTRQHDFFF